MVMGNKSLSMTTWGCLYDVAMYFDGHDSRCEIRYTDFVECTAPVLKTSMLLDTMFDRALAATRTGCFLDFCFHPVSGARPIAVAIIDAVQCHHPPRHLM